MKSPLRLESKTQGRERDVKIGSGNFNGSVLPTERRRVKHGGNMGKYAQGPRVAGNPGRHRNVVAHSLLPIPGWGLFCLGFRRSWETGCAYIQCAPSANCGWVVVGGGGSKNNGKLTDIITVQLADVDRTNSRTRPGVDHSIG